MPLLIEKDNGNLLDPSTEIEVKKSDVIFDDKIGFFDGNILNVTAVVFRLIKMSESQDELSLILNGLNILNG